MGDVFTALAAPTRRVILDELQERDGRTLLELITRLIPRHGLASSRQAVSRHPGVLEAAGWCTPVARGRCTLSTWTRHP